MSQVTSKAKSLGGNAIGSFNKHAKRNYSILGGLALVIVYGIVQLSMLNASGPQQLADRYLAAISSGSNESLSDETLFPNPDGLELAPSGIAASADTTGTVTSSLFGNDASISLKGAYGDSIGKIRLKAEDHWNFIFRTRTWSIVSRASTITIGKPTVASLQGFAYGLMSFQNVSDRKFSAYSGKTYLAMPGVYVVSSDSFGFNDASNQAVTVAPESSVTLAPVKASELAIADAQAGAALSKAEAKQRACVKSQCASMPYFSESDFYFSDNDPSDDYYYDESYSSKSYSADGCTLSSSTPLSALKATFTYDCDVSANITVTHVVTYYFLADDYSYFYGTSSDTMSIRVTMVFDPKTGRFKLS